MSLKPRQILGKYKILRRLASGGFANVYSAHDTVEGIDVALKVPHDHIVARGSLKDFKREVRLSSQLDHPNILPIKTAGDIDGHFIIVTPLGAETLRDRYHRRLTSATILSITEQLLEALAHAHDHRIAHCDVKPENIILFGDGRIRLADFGIARIAMRTLHASGSGTVGFMAPEQAMGKPSLKSDVFSAGLVIARMAGGHLPEWPFEWPFPEHDRMLRRFSPAFLAFLRKAVHIHASRRYPHARAMLNAFLKVKPRALQKPTITATSSRTSSGEEAPLPRKSRSSGADWKSVRIRQFKREFGEALGTRDTCHRCKNPVSPAMISCPWCGISRKVLRDPEPGRKHCGRCKRTLRKDWRFCPWCYGAAVGPDSPRRLGDPRYIAACTNPGCERKQLLPFMRYCPWCRQKVTRPWRVPGQITKCKRGHTPMIPDYWSQCPWCPGKSHKGTR